MKICKYNYMVEDLSDEDGAGYAAIVPRFPKLLVMADTLKELHDMVIYGIEMAIKQRKKEGRPIPSPDIKHNSSFKGKIIIRTTPELHEKLYYEAKANQKSLNKYIESKLQAI